MALLALGAGWCSEIGAALPSQQHVDFARDVRPLLETRCHGCHGPKRQRGKLQPGSNSITLRLHNPHHFAGIFRRPFLYRPAG